jgi:hypothetical protein
MAFYSTLYSSPVSTIISPVSSVYSTSIYSQPNGYTTVGTTTLLKPYVYSNEEYDDFGLNNNYLAQKQMTEYLYYRVLDKWLGKDELSYLLKYLIIKNGVVHVVKNESEYSSNKISSNTKDDVRLKSKFIEENIFRVKDLKKMLIKFTMETGYKYYELDKKEPVVIEYIGRQIKRKLKEMM